MMRSHHNVGASVLFCIAHMYEPPMAQFDGIVINVWENRRFTRKVVEHNNLWLIARGKVPVMRSAESGGTFKWHNLFDPL